MRIEAIPNRDTTALVTSNRCSSGPGGGFVLLVRLIHVGVKPVGRRSILIGKGVYDINLTELLSRGLRCTPTPEIHYLPVGAGGMFSPIFGLDGDDFTLRV